MGTGRPAGRPAKPTELKRLEGNNGHRPLPAAPLPSQGLEAANGSIPEPPETMGEYGVAIWNEMWGAIPYLAAKLDIHQLRKMCFVEDETERLRIRFDAGYGCDRPYCNNPEDKHLHETYETGQGQIVIHPMYKVMQQNRSQLTSWYASFGFTPSDRARLGLGEVREHDPLDEVNKRRLERKNSNEQSS